MATLVRTRTLSARSVTFRTNGKSAVPATAEKVPARPSFLSALLRALSSFSM